MKLSEKLRLLREEKGMTQEQVCNELEIGIQTLRNYENDNADRLPNTFQLSKIKNFYNVTYEYLLDDNCENKTNESTNIGKALQLSDTSINRIKDLQFFTDSIFNNVREDKTSPVAFNRWIEDFSDLHHFARSLNHYYIIYELLDDIVYFASIPTLSSYINFCLNENNQKLELLFDMLDKKNEYIKQNIINGICLTLDYSDYENFNDSYQEVKYYFNSYKKSSKKRLPVNIDDDNDWFNIANYLLTTTMKIYENLYRELKFQSFEIIESLKTSLVFPADDISIPQEYEKLKKSINLKGENN